MGRKGARRRKKDNDNDGDGGDLQDCDYLSETHTIATLNSSIGEDGAWGELVVLDEDDDWELNNQADPQQALEASERRRRKLEDTLATAADYATEKRATKREALLKTWFRGITHLATYPDLVGEPTEEILRACRQGVRQGSPAEQYAACRVLEALAIVVALDEESRAQIQPTLERVLDSSNRAVPVRIAALRAWTLALVWGVDQEEEISGLLGKCESLMRSKYRDTTVPASLRAAAVDAWTQLAITFPSSIVAGEDEGMNGKGLEILPLLLDCLSEDDNNASSLRVAAGECVAFIHACRIELGSQNTEDDDGGQKNTTQLKYAIGDWEKSQHEDLIAELTQRIHELSNPSGYNQSKKAKREQRGCFRDILSTLQDNETAPSETIQFQGGVLELTAWRDVLVLQYVRRGIQSGLQYQLLNNSRLQEALGADVRSLSRNSGYSQLEKRLILSKASEAAKRKDMDRTKKRNIRRNVQNDFLTVDE